MDVTLEISDGISGRLKGQRRAVSWRVRDSWEPVKEEFKRAILNGGAAGARVVVLSMVFILIWPWYLCTMSTSLPLFRSRIRIRRKPYVVGKLMTP